ncbi:MULTISPECIES: serine hydrolase domain-containing protein [unclassified Chamaesiphon]|uniref:serine hydrolase domain-containing protein n=1 Tax=unclassified Chamaesiphon TaxID=2620921 RepID=UPI00286C24DD|nr:MULTISPECIES: serine hydrolase domain-containing protein [unclassified Chamaesiphon]
MSSITDKVDRLFTQWDKPNSPGCALAVIQNGEIIYKRGYGMANLEYDIPITPNSVFDIGSNSKQFTAMCIVLLARQNLLTLDDELQKHIPEIPQYTHPITLRHLSCHTSGLRDYLTLMEMSGSIGENNYLTEDIISLVTRQQSLNFQPGTEQLYSNTGYLLLAEIIKRVSGKSLRVFAEEHIFTPLGMKNTHFHDDFRAIVKNRADAYEPKEDRGFQTALSWLDCCGDGQLYTTVEDLSLWDRNFYHNILGGYGQDLIEEITTPGKLDNGETISGAFGLQISDRGGLETISHGGSWMGYQSQFIRFPDRNFSVICLANLGTFNPNKLAFEVADIYLKNEYPQAIAKLMPRSVTPIDLPLAELEIRTGLYHNPTTNSVWELELKDEKLMAKLAWMYFQLVLIDATHFQSVDNEIDYDLDFHEDPTRPIVKVDIGNGVKEFTLEKMLETAPDLLTDYVGTYYADELEFSYQLYLDDNKIRVKHKGIEPFQLRSIRKDFLLFKADKFEFIRDDRGIVIGFDRCSDRVRRVHFSKQ